MTQSTKLLQTQAATLAVKNPQLARSPERLHEKAQVSLLAVIFGSLSIVLFIVGALVSYKFAMSALDQKTPATAMLFLSLLIPLVPGSTLGLITAFKFDPDAGSVASQFATTIGSVRAAVLGRTE